MGVHGLWELLAPVGRRVSVDTLAGKKLAIDASIWMIQFMKAMRDEKGEMVRNAHILGFFRRICKLLYLRTKPVFVFDGGTPALKRRTVIARRRQRENAQAKIRKTAEKLLLNQLKTMRLKELAADIEKQRRERDTKGKKRIIEEPRNEQETQKGNNGASIGYNQEELDEMLAASIAAEENEGSNVDTSTSGAPDYDELYEEDEDEEMILPEMHGKVDPAVLAALPPSMQLDLLVQMRERLMAENRQKYQKVKKVPARFSELQIESYLKTVAFRREIDGVQKSAAGKGIGGVQTSRIASEANREFIFSSSFTGDKQTLTSVGQGRREADQVEAPPINSSAMAPPVNSPAKAPLVNYPSKAPTVNSPTTAVNVHLTKRSDATPGPNVSETAHDGVETYVDERGRIRVSRVRALGIRMTRDLQRNLDLMKEIDQQKLENNLEKINESASAGGRDGVTDNSSGRIQHQEAIDKTDGRMDYEIDEAEVPTFENGASIEISFEDTLERQGYDDNDDKLFARLVAGDNVTDFSVDNSEIVKEPLRSVSDNEWEDGIIEGKSMEHLHEERCSDEEEVEWEEGLQDIQLKMSSCPVESQKTVTKGAPEEETAFQEAIFRSLEDKMDDFKESYTSERAKDVSFEEEVEWEEGSQDIQLKSCLDKKTVSNGAMEEEAAFQEAIRRSLEDASGSMVGLHKIHPSVRAREIVNEKTDCISICARKEHLDVETFTNDVRQPFGSMNDIDTNRSEEKSATSVRVNPDQGNLELKPVNLVAGESRASAGEMPAETCGEDDIVPMVNKLEGTCSGNASHDNGSSAFNDSNVSSCYADAHMFHVESGDHFCDTEKVKETSADDSGTNVDGAKELTKDKVVGNFSREKDEVIMSNSKEQEIMEDRLEEEMLFLDKEREQLGSEQRKLERDAESVSNEMFAECQELLQMFGLPYIIAPMEAEAQCAFMELSNLVDGVVTDDSDAFLFGAQSVYKNIFDDRKYVETYLMKDIESEIGLDREKLIRMALLLGSDYTEGISGIGIVNAIEVVNAFPGKDGLREFREWIESPDPSILGKLHVEKGGNSRKKGLKVTENIMSDSNSNVEGTSCDQPQAVDDDAIRKRQTFMDKHRNVSKNWHISTSFPSDAVISAYASPQVDKSLEPFSWGKPDLFVLRKLCWEKFGWGAPKADELLVPVLKEYNKHETQLRLEAFYTFNENFAKIRSKRIEKAVRGITGPKSSALIDKTSQQSVSGRKRKAKPCEDEANQSKVDSIDNSSQNNTTRKPTVKGRQRGRGRGQQGGGRGRRKTNSFGIDAQISKDDDSISENDKEMQQVSEDVHQVRRSGRARKSVDYTVSDESHNSDNKDETYFKEALMDQEVSEIDKHNKNQLSEGGDVVMRGEISVEETEGTPHGVINKDKSVVYDDQMDDPSDHGQSSKEYLQFGGGFCLDEDEEKECSREMVGEKGDLLDNEVNMNDKSSLSDPAHSSLDDTEDDPGNSNRVYLRAIPNLRRKKSRR